MSDSVPERLMTPDRMAWAASFGLAQRIPKAIPEAVARPEIPPEANALPVPAAPAFPVRALSLVGQEITGRQALVLQVPGGQVRFEGSTDAATEKARELAGSEEGAFVVLRPVVLIAPKTSITEEPLDG